MDATEKIPRTALDVFRMLPEGTLCEVIDNALYVSPVPKYTHQRLVGLFARKLSEHVEKHGLGEVFISPVDVYLEEFRSAVQPDLIFVSKQHQHIMAPDGYFYGAPDLVVEVLSTDKKRDTHLKKNLYERAGVQEYFIADPESRHIQLFTLRNKAFYLAYEAVGQFTSQLLGLAFGF